MGEFFIMKARKVEIKKVEEVLNDKGVDTALIQEVVSTLQTPDEIEDDEPPEKMKKQYFIIVSDPDGKLPPNDFVGWVGQMDETEAPHTVMDKIHAAGYEYNTSRKGRKQPVSTIGEIMECVGAKYCKPAGFWKKTVEPILVVKTDNKLPTN